jgi:hypothetical protein
VTLVPRLPGERLDVFFFAGCGEPLGVCECSVLTV